jgi:bifunctional non-homologous end joining protein LigD
MPRRVKDGSLTVGGRTVQVTSVDKPFFPETGMTKGDLLAYYRDVAETMLPHLAGRAHHLLRFHKGVDGHGFWQQGASDHFPDWVRTVTVERRGRGGTVDHVVCEDAATIVYLANLATVTFHAWTSTVQHLARPDLVILDLDPDPDQGLEVVRAAARAVRAACQELGLAPFVQTSGSKGYHVVTPLRPGPDVEVVRDFAAELAALVAARDPGLLYTSPSPRDRG